MPFDSNTKARMFIKCARICCLCFKQCGVNIEAAHIVAEADGGSNTDDNGIPLCFDCHQETGGYTARHPKGNKFSHAELKARRDKVYELIDNGTMQAQIIAKKLHAGYATVDIQEKEIKADIYKPSKETRAVLQLAIKSKGTVTSLPLKLNLLSEREQAYIIDQLLENAESDNNMESLFFITANENYKDKALLILEQVLRKVTLSTDVNLKKEFMDVAPIKLLPKVDQGLKTAFFSEIISILEQVQYGEVNKLTTPLIRIQEAIPEEIQESYVDALINLVDSGAWSAAPAAVSGLTALPDNMLSYLFNNYDKKFMERNLKKEYKNILGTHKSKWPADKKKLFNDYINLTDREFLKAHIKGYEDEDD